MGGDGSPEQFLQHMVLRVGPQHPPPQGLTAEGCRGAVHPACDGRCITSPNCSCRECGEPSNKGLFFKQVYFPWQKVSLRCLGSVQLPRTMLESGILPCLSCLKGSQRQQPA